MLSNRIYALMAFHGHFLAFFGVIPWDWCSKTRKAIPSAKAAKRTRFNTFLIILWAIFAIFQLIRFHLLKDYHKFKIVCLYGTGAFLCSESFALLVFRGREGMLILNNLIFYLNHMNRVYLPKYNPNKSKLSLFLELSLISISSVFVCVIPINWLLVFRFPRSPNFYGSILPETGCPMIANILVVYVCPMYMMFVMYLNLLSYSLIIFLYGVVIIPFVLLEFRVGRKRESYFGCHELRKPPLLWNAWRTVQVLQDLINDYLGWMLVPTQMIFGELVVLCVFMILKQKNELTPSKKLMWALWATMGGIFWSSVLLMGGYIHLFGRKVLTSWKYHKWYGMSKFERRVMKKFQRSCVPLSISYGKTYVIKRLTVLKFIRGILTGIFRALLTIGVKR